jgi:MtaA/CmuA family methyltransferase
MIRGERVDIVPRVPILMQFAAEYIGSNYGAFASDHRVLVEANIRCAEDFGFDQLSTISDPYRETQGFGAEIEYVTDGVPRCKTPPLADTRDISVLKDPDPLVSERMRDRVDAVRLYKERTDDNYSILGWIEGPAAEAADLRGVGTFLVDLIDDESFSCQLMDRCLDTGIDFAKAQIKTGADTVGVGDAIASQLSPDMYERLVLPREKWLVDSIHSMGGLVRLHICGDITHLLPGIASLGVDILDVDHMVDMAEVRRIVGSGVTLAGNIDPAAGVRFGSPEDIRKTVRSTYEAVGNPFLVNAGCEIPAGTPNENLSALCEPIHIK